MTFSKKEIEEMNVIRDDEWAGADDGTCVVWVIPGEETVKRILGWFGEDVIAALAAGEKLIKICAEIDSGEETVVGMYVEICGGDENDRENTDLYIRFGRQEGDLIYTALEKSGGDAFRDFIRRAKEKYENGFWIEGGEALCMTM